MRTILPLVGLLLMVAVNLPAAEPTLRVMSFNVRYAAAPDGDNAWDKRKESLVKVIRAFDPDLLGGQEVLALQVDYLGEQLQDYTPVGIGRDDGKRQGEFCSVFYKNARFETVDSGTFWLSETPDLPGSKSWDSSLPRIATWVKLRGRAAGNREVCFLNTHWDHRGNRARVEAAKLIRRWINDHATRGPTIITGDFNLDENHEGYRTLVAEPASGPRLFDSYRQLHTEPQGNEATFHGFTGRVEGKRIDFVLHTADLTTSEAAIVRTNAAGRYPSDHFPVTAVLRYHPSDAK